MSQWMSVKEAAEQLGVDQSTVYRLCQSRKIQHRRIGAGGGRIVFRQEDLAAYLASCLVPVGPLDPDPVESPGFRLKHVRLPGTSRF